MLLTTLAVIAPLLLPTSLPPMFLTVNYGKGHTTTRGYAVAAPHDGYDQHSGIMARGIAQRLSWGWVKATGFRSYPLRHWYDVNRPTERVWRHGGFADGRVTAEGRRIHADYVSKLRKAANVTTTGRLHLLVEIHGHTRSVRAGHSTLQVEAIELASTGLTRAQLQRVKLRYDQLVRAVPAAYRVPLAIDRLHSEYEVGNWIVPFYFYANGAKRTGSLQSRNANKALHFELPGKARSTQRARTAYTRLLAELIKQTAADVK